MAQKTINTRIQNKFATWAEWQSVWQTFIPLKGEVCKVQIPAGVLVDGLSMISKDIRVLTKTGDGVHVISHLPWDGGAVDVVTASASSTEVTELKFGNSFDVGDILVSSGNKVSLHKGRYRLPYLPELHVNYPISQHIDTHVHLKEGFIVREEFCETFEGTTGKLKQNYVVIYAWDDYDPKAKDNIYTDGDKIDVCDAYLTWEQDADGRLMLIETLAEDVDTEEYQTQAYYYCGIKNYDGTDYDLWGREEETTGYSTLYTERITNNDVIEAKTYREMNKYFLSDISNDGQKVTASFDKESEITVSSKRTSTYPASHGEIVELVQDISAVGSHEVLKDSVRLKLPEETPLTVNTKSYLDFNDSVTASDGVFHTPVPVVYVEILDSGVYSDGPYSPDGREFIAYKKINNGITLYKLHRETGEAEYDFPFEYCGEDTIDGAILDKWCCKTDPEFSILYYYTDKIVEYKNFETITPEPGEEIDVITKIEVGQTSHSIDVKRARITLPSKQTFTTVDEENCSFNVELASSEGWTTDGWTGSFESGFTHDPGNTSPLVYNMPVATGTKLYQVSFDCSKTLASMDLFVTVGNSETFDTFGQKVTSFGIRSVEDGTLQFIPSTSFAGTISNISVREIVGEVSGIREVVDSTGSTSFEIRTTTADKDNIFMGIEGGMNNTSGYGNASLGAKALKNNTSGFWNTGIGYETLKENTSGSRNIGIGYGALKSNITGQRNIGIGTYALINNTNGGWNVAIGADSQDHNKTGNKNIGLGFQTLYSNESGSNNIAIGNTAMSNCGNAECNVAIGDAALRRCAGAYNVGIGKSSLYNNESGTNNTAIGLNTLYRSTGNSNTAIGTGAAQNIVSGNNNVAIGANAGKCTVASNNLSDNVFIGAGSGSGVSDGASYNIMIGKNAGSTSTTGTNNILIGYLATTDNASDSYKLNIGGLLRGSLKNADKHLLVDGGLRLPAIPTTDPNVAGAVWNDNGVLKVSAG